MTKLQTSIIRACGTMLLSGHALAAGPMPAAGEGPFFSNMDASTSDLQRADVRADELRSPPVKGEMNTQADPLAPSTLARAQVRMETRDAIAGGYHNASGEQSDGLARPVMWRH